MTRIGRVALAVVAAGLLVGGLCSGARAQQPAGASGWSFNIAVNFSF